jgi:WD40 repeat protein/DNA-binding SARP family transcriptional activator
MRFQVLGPLEVEADGGPVRVAGQKERVLLAQLLARPNQVVPVERLIQALWGQHPPRTCEKSLQSYVVRLRHALEPGRARGAAGEVLVTRKPGYLLRVAPGMLDATRFEELTATARDLLSNGRNDLEAASVLREALSLWRGQAFEEFADTEFGAAEADRLGELRLVAVEDRIEADLRLGRHRELVAEVESLIRSHPLRERLWAHLMLALYRAGRQADALLAYQRARAVLVGELGIDPGAELRRVQAAILSQDRALDLLLAAEAAGSTAAPVLPAALSLALAGPPFAGRATVWTWLRAAWTQATSDRGRIAFLAGAQGIGKTRLAAELAREVHDQGGWVLYRRATPDRPNPIEPLDQSSDRPVLLILDDLHLAGRPVWEALTNMTAAAATRRLLVLAAFQEEVAGPGLTALVERLDPDGVAFRRLGPLEQEEVAQILALYGDEEPARAAAIAVLERTGGLPLPVHLAARDWAQAQAARRVEETVSQTASSRSHLRAVQARLTDNVGDLQKLREQADVDPWLATDQGASPPHPDDRPATAICPYKGLARFEASDAAFFFGRERLVAELVTHLVGAGLVGVIGPSGSGKSSLVRAGLLPALRDGVLPGSDRWRQVILRPGEHPMRELTHATEGLGARAAGSGEEQPRLLVVDQFEEVFTACHDENEQAAFLGALPDAARALDGRVTVVVTVRADYYGHCTANADLAGLLAANHVLVGPMNEHELLRAIQLPARAAGLRLDAGLAAAMVGDVVGEPGGLPLLSTALLEGWERRRGRTLTLDAYHQAGGVRGAVARLAERAWHGLNPEQQQVARRILLRLAGPGEGEAAVRRRVPLSEFTAIGGDGRLVLDALADRRLLTKSEDAVELAHEALLREWPRLGGWLEEDAQGRALHRHLIGAAREWEATGRDPAELYRGARLASALDWAQEHSVELNELERAYLDASRAAAEHDVADARRRAEHEARVSRRLRGLVAGLAFVMVLAIVASGFALAIRGRSEREALVADARRLGALALTEDELDRSLVLARQGIALDDSLETRGDLLAALLRSPAAIGIIRGPLNGRLDGISALGISGDGSLLAVGDADGTVWIFDLRTRRRIPGDFQARDQINDLDFSPDGSLLAIATSGYGDGARIWDVQAARERLRLPPSGPPDVPIEMRTAEFSADGKTLLTLSEDTSKGAGSGVAYLTRWGVRSGRPLQGPVLISSHGGDVLVGSRDDTELAIVNGTEVLVRAADTFRPLRRYSLGLRQPQLFTAALSPHDHRTLALGSSDGWVEFLDLATGRRRPAIGQHDGAVLAIQFSPDGTSLATGGGDRLVKLWDVASGQVHETLQGHEARSAGLRFSPQGGTLYSAGSKSVIAWDLQGAGRFGHPFSFAADPADSAPACALPALAVSPDGSLLATPDGTKADQIALRGMRSPEKIGRSLPLGIGRISAMRFSPDGKRLAVSGERAPAPVLVDVATGAVQRRMTGRNASQICSIQFAPNGRQLSAGSFKPDPRASVWDTSTGRRVRDFLRPGQGDVTVAWSPDGRMLATAGGNGTVAVWRTSDWEEITTLHADTSWATTVAFSPDGSLLAAAGLDARAVTLWDVATWKLAGRLPHPIFTASVTFDPKGRTLTTAAYDGNLRLWDVASRRQIGPALPGPQCDQCGRNVTEFDPSGTQLVALDANGAGYLWDTDPELWRRRACVVAGRSLTREEWHELLPGRDYRPACH